MITLQQDETILLEVHKHWLGILIHAFILSVLAIIPLSIGVLVVPYTALNATTSAYLFFGALWVFFVWTMFFVMWTNYYLDTLVITNKRLIDMEQFVLFSRDEVVIPLQHIEDIKVEVRGFVATVLGFGDLQIQTAGAVRETITEKIMRPHLVRTCLEGAVEAQKRAV